MSSEKLKSNALQSATYDTILKIGLRIVSFILNSIVVRHIGAATFAVCSVKLLLLYSTTNLLTREAFRRAALTAKSDQINYKLINLIWLGTVYIVPVSVFLSYIWMYLMEQPTEAAMVNRSSHYPICIAIILLSCVVELSAEVPFIISELQQWNKIRVLIEGITQLVRSVLIALVVLYFPSYAVIGYCLSHLIGSLVYSLGYYSVFHQAFSDKQTTKKLPITTTRQLLPSFSVTNVWFEIDATLKETSKKFMGQSWLKQLLTEGEWYLMNFLPVVSQTVQGNYQVVTNLGSLGARLVFRSIEDAAYKYFGQTLQRDVPLPLQDKDKVQEAAVSLQSLLRYMLLLGLTIICFGWSYSSFLLLLYGGREFSADSTHLMRAECVLMAFLAINGVTEAYIFAAMSQEHLSKHSQLLVFFSITYIVLCGAFSYFFGVIGFAVANCINMILRIGYGWWFIQQQFAETVHRPLQGLRLSSTLLYSLLFGLTVSAISEGVVYPSSVLAHLSVGVFTFAIFLFFLRYECQYLYTSILNKLRNRIQNVRLLKCLDLIEYILYNIKQL